MKIVFVYLNDWCGMYVDGLLRYQSHRIDGITAAQVIKEVQAACPNIDLNILSVKGKWPEAAFGTMLESRGNQLPERLDDCILED